MSIRYRLLLIIGLASSVIFITSFFLENAVLSKGITRARAEIEIVYEGVIEKKRESLEGFIGNFLAQQLAQINVFLQAISKFQALSEWFAPNEENLKEGTWNSAATLLQSDDWIDFLQNTVDGKLLSLIVPDPGPFSQIKSVPIVDGLAWVSLLDIESHPAPFLGIELPVKSVEAEFEEPSSLLASGHLPTVYILYDFEKFKTIQFPVESNTPSDAILRTPLMQGYELDEEKFLSFFYKAIDLASDPDFKCPPKKEVIDKKVNDSLEKENRFDLATQSYLDSMVEYSSELFLIWELTSLRNLSLLGDSMNDPRWPEAVSFSESGDHEGSAFFLKDTIAFSKPFFDDQAFFAANPPKNGSLISSGATVIKSPHPNEAFIVNTASIVTNSGNKNRSLLTIGFNLSDFLYNLTATSGFYTYAVSGKEILIEVSPEGVNSLPKEALHSLISQEIESLSGVITLLNVEYFFMRVHPDPDLDLYFYILQPKEVTFSPLKDVQEKISRMIKRLRLEQEGIELLGILILWILLIDLSKKITRPIIQLSNSLKYVKTEEWDLIKMPKIKMHKNNEIRQLWDSFLDMVAGLKEKEKMSTILNKVVSKEIACEILKGDILLGGEEKIVTILFVDIRGFTKMTQNMAPQEVIDLLNKCMTKLSIAVEDNKGVIDKYLGDGFMALYGAPIAYKESPFCAVLSAMEMIDIIQKWDEERIQEGLVPLNIGIGVHTGAVCAGNMGAQNRLNYTVIGSHVNLASRLCYAAGPGELLITADTYLDPTVQPNIEVEDKGFMSFKGFDDKKQVYKVLKLI